MIINNSRHVAPINAYNRNLNAKSRLRFLAFNTVIIASILALSFLSAIILLPDTVIAKPETEPKPTESTTATSLASNSGKLDISNNNESTTQEKSEVVNKNTPFNNSSATDLKNLQKSAEEDKALTSKNKTSKKTTPTTEVLLNLGYDDPGDQKDDTSFFGNLLSGITSVIGYILSIALVLVLGVFAIYGVKLFSAKYGTFAGAGSDLLNILEVKYIAPGKAICLVEIADKVLVLSMAGNAINHLSDITDQGKVDALKLAAEKKKTEPLQPFQVMLDKISNRSVNRKTKRDPHNRSQTKESRTKQTESTSEWQDELHTTGDNIRKLLEEIAEQDKPTKKTRHSTKRNRGGEQR